MDDGGRLTDKATLGYHPVYAGLLAGKPDADVLEIGIAYGGSLFMWRQLAPEGRITGVSIEACPDEPEFARLIVADQSDPRLPETLGPGKFDLIVDDASHVGSLSGITFLNLWPLVKPGGWYVLEDWPVGLPSNPFYGHFSQEKSMLALAQSFVERIRPARDITDMGGCTVPAGDPEDAVEARYIYGMAMLRKKEA